MTVLIPVTRVGNAIVFTLTGLAPHRRVGVIHRKERS